MVSINTPQEKEGPDGTAIVEILNDLNDGSYDVVMDTVRGTKPSGSRARKHYSTC